MTHKRSTMTRRLALQLCLGAGLYAALPSFAQADTSSDLADAQAKLAQAQQELDVIASEYEQLSAEQSRTLDDIEEIEGKIRKIETRIAQLEKQLEKKQRELSSAVSNEYKDGSRGVVDLMLRSETVEDLISNLYCYEKVTEQQAQLIQDVKDTQDRYVNQKVDLEEQQALLEEVSRTQQEQLEAMRDKQLEAQQVIDGLDKEVKELIAKRDAELLAAQQEAERARKEREEAQKKAAEQSAAEAAAQEAEASATSDTSSDASYEQDESPSYSSSSAGTGSAAKVVAACHSTPSPGLGLCAGWCSNVMINAGYGFVSGNANDMYAAYCHSSNRGDLMPGMAVAVSSHPHTSAGRIYGHIGMYIGSGTMMDNIGYIRTISVDEWCSFYGATVTPRWGWLNNIVLT